MSQCAPPASNRQSVPRERRWRCFFDRSSSFLIPYSLLELLAKYLMELFALGRKICSSHIAVRRIPCHHSHPHCLRRKLHRELHHHAILDQRSIFFLIHNYFHLFHALCDHLAFDGETRRDHRHFATMLVRLHLPPVQSCWIKVHGHARSSRGRARNRSVGGNGQ